jgi:DNA invertase Pin-like site-specific DNA recombinase
MSEKIHNTHLERAAYIYIRQSTMHQVREHLESQRRQYELAERARQLKFREVVVIDDDLGRSGTGSQERPGFGKLLAAVCDGRVGAVFALEASRLARNNRDWHRQRAQEALREMIARGEALWEQAVGYVRNGDNGVEMVADRQVQEAIRGVFTKFRELGTARQVLLWYRQEQIALPHLEDGSSGSDITWRLPIYNQILKLLQNPVYAGAFVHGRTVTKIVMREGRARKTHGNRVPREE